MPIFFYLSGPRQSTENPYLFYPISEGKSVAKNTKTSGATSLHLSPSILNSFNSELELVLNDKNSFKQLEKQLSQFDQKIKEAAKSNEFIDLNLAMELYLKCSTILSIVETSKNTERNLYLLAAVSYFFRANDAANDFQTIDGFEDDQEVINAVLTKFNLTETINSEIQKKKSKGAIA